MSGRLFSVRLPIAALLFALGLLAAVSSQAAVVKADPAELRQKTLEVLQSYRAARNSLIKNKQKSRSQLLYRNKLKILDNKIKYLEREAARLAPAAAKKPKRPAPAWPQASSKAQAAPSVSAAKTPAAKKPAARKESAPARKTAPSPAAADRNAKTLPLKKPAPVQNPAPPAVPLAPRMEAMPAARQFAIETAPLPAPAPPARPAQTPPAKTAVRQKPAPVEIRPTSYAPASAPSKPQAALGLRPFPGRTDGPAAAREAPVRLPEPVRAETPAPKPEAAAAPQSPTGRDWLSMDEGYKTLQLLSIMGRLINYDVIAWKSQSFYAHAIDEAIAADPSLEAVDLNEIFFRQLERFEPENASALVEIRREFAKSPR